MGHERTGAICAEYHERLEKEASLLLKGRLSEFEQSSKHTFSKPATAALSQKLSESAWSCLAQPPIAAAG
jgi:hypothetical protein